jgi:AraC family transcriptional regulator
VALDPYSSLQRGVFMSGRGFTYFAQTPGLPLSLKCMSNGRALYKFGRAEVAVDDSGYLILNNQQPYSIEIASPTQVETFVLWFPNGWADEVARTASKPDEDLLADPATNGNGGVSFFSRYTPHDTTVSPKVRALRIAFRSNKSIEDSWLEERLRDLLAAMVASQHKVRRQSNHLSAARLATRQELWRRVNLARDYLHAHLGTRVSLCEVARAACLSPFHLLRVFQAAFEQSPHQYLTERRLDRAKFLLEKTSVPVTAICLNCGFSSLGSFSSLFRGSCGMSPRAWRNRYAAVPPENSKIQEVYLTGPT